MKRVPARSVLDPVHFFALGFGSGLIPRAPGTAGTAVALVLDLGLRQLDFRLHVIICLVALVAGVWICDASARRLGVHDHPAIVWDEIAAFLPVLMLVPLNWAWLATAFILFRIFDIWKPWPIRELDHSMGGGLGIMLDDVIAAAYSAACLAVLLQFF